jgi:hypothetical protein
MNQPSSWRCLRSVFILGVLAELEIGNHSGSGTEGALLPSSNRMDRLRFDEIGPDGACRGKTLVGHEWNNLRCNHRARRLDNQFFRFGEKNVSVKNTPKSDGKEHLSCRTLQILENHLKTNPKRWRK